MAWTINDIRFGQDGSSSISWSAACNASVTNWSKSDQLIVAAWLSSSDHAPGSHSVKLQWRNKTDNPSGSFAEFVTGSGELRAGTSAGVLSNTSAVGDGSGCQTKGDPAIDEEIENESPLQSGSFSPAKNEYIESQWCIDFSNALDSKEYEFELYDVTGDVSLGIFSYTVTIQAGTDDLTADNLLSGTPVLGTPTVGVIHNLTADNLTGGQPVLGTPTVGIIHNLTADNLTGGQPVLASPDIGQIHGLTADNLLSGTPVLGTPTLTEGGTDDLTADNLLSGTPVLGSPTVGVIHNLATDNLLSGTPVLGTPTLTEIHNLVADNLLSGTPEPGNPTIGVIHNLIADNLLSGTPVISVPDIGQIHALAASNLTAGQPQLGTPTLSEGIDDLTADNLITQNPVLGSPTLSIIVAAQEVEKHHAYLGKRKITIHRIDEEKEIVEIMQNILKSGIFD